MSIYTRKGDEGKTGTLGGQRMLKNTPLIALLGKIDSVVSYVGVANMHDRNDLGTTIQKKLMDLSTVLSSLFRSGQSRLDVDNKYVRAFNVEQTVDDFEKQIDELMAAHGPLREFVIPSGHWHYARCLVREAEVLYGTFLEWVIFEQDVAPDSRVMTVVQSYGKVLNRLSDLVFALAINLTPPEQRRVYHPCSA